MEWSDVLWPLHPGCLDRPRETLELIRRLAHAVDPVLQDSLGFGVSDLTELGLRIMGLEREVVKSHWVRDRVGRSDDPATVTQAEVNAVSRLLAIWRSQPADSPLPELLLERLAPVAEGNKERLARALDWATARPASARLHVGHEYEELGALALATGAGLLPMPGGLMLKALAQLAHRLAREAARLERSIRGRRDTSDTVARLFDQAQNMVVRSLLAFPAVVLVGARVVDIGRSAPLILIASAARHLVAISLAVDPTGDSAIAINKAKRAVERVVAGCAVRLGQPVELDEPPPGDYPFDLSVLDGHPVDIRDDVEVTRVVLVDGPRKSVQEFRRGTIVLGVEEWSRLVREASQAEELWAFLDELKALPGVRVARAWSIFDLWEEFRKNGVLHGSGADKLELGFLPADTAAEWERLAAVERFDLLALEVGLPRMEKWPRWAQLGDDRAIALSLEPYCLALMNSTSSFVVVVRESEVKVDHSLKVALAETLCSGLRQIVPGISLPVPDISLRVGLIPLTFPDAEHRPVRFVGLMNDEIVLTFDPRFVGLRDSETIHGLLGASLAEGLAMFAMVTSSEAPPEDGTYDLDLAMADNSVALEVYEAVFERWKDLPVQLHVAQVASPFAVQDVSSTAQLAPVGDARVRRDLARVLHGERVGPLRASGAEATRLLRQRVVPAVIAVLDQELARFDPVQAVPAVAAQIERTLAGNSRDDFRRSVSSETIDGATAEDALLNTVGWRAAHLVLEQMMHTTPVGHARLDDRDWFRLVHLAALALELSGRASAADSGAEELDVTVASDGVVTVHVSAGRLDLAAYNAELLRVHLDRQTDRFEESFAPQPATETERPFQSFSVALSEAPNDDRNKAMRRALLDFDQASRASLGTGLEGLFAVLQTAAAWPVSGDVLVADVPVDALVESVVEWSGLAIDEVEAAVRELTLNHASLAATGVDFWNVERRQARLATRPLVGLPRKGAGARVCVLPRQAHATQQIFANYLGSQRVPWPDESLPAALRTVVKKWAQAGQRAFEKEVVVAVEENGFRHVRAVLRPDKAAKDGLIIPGEIDLLVADPVRRRIWVVEAKNRHKPYSIEQVLNEVRKFHGMREGERSKAKQKTSPDKAEVGKLLAKADALRRQTTAALNATGLPAEDPVGWTMWPVIVSPNPLAAAFIDDPRVPFACVRGFKRMLVSDADPVPGHLSDFAD